MREMILSEARLEARDRAGALLDPSVTRLHWLLIALLPVIMAATTWGPEHYHYSIQVWLRFFSLPVLIVEVIVIAVALAGGVRPFAIFRRLPVPMQAALGVVAGVAWGTALIVARDPAVAILRTSTSFIHVCFGFAVAGLVARTPPRFDRDVWPLIVIGLLLYLPMAVVYVLTISDPEHFEWLHFGLAVSNIRFVGFFAAVGAAAALALACLAGRSRSYCYWVLAATLFMGLMFWSGSRNPVLAVSMACLIGAGIVPAMRTARMAIAWVCSVVGGALISLIYIPPNSVYGLYRMIFSIGLEDPNAIASGRLVLWGGGLEAFTARPLFGFGEGQFIHVVPEALSIYHHPHNLVVQFLVQWGAVGASFALVLLALAWWHIMRMTRRSVGQLLPAFLVLTALMVASFFDGVFFFVYPSMMVALTMALALGTILRNQTNDGALQPVDRAMELAVS